MDQGRECSCFLTTLSQILWQRIKSVIWMKNRRASNSGLRMTPETCLQSQKRQVPPGENQKRIGTNSYVQVLREVKHRRSSVTGRLFLRYTANCAVTGEICRRILDWKGLNLREGCYEYRVSAPVAACYGTRYWPQMKVNWSELKARRDEKDTQGSVKEIHQKII